MKSIIASAAVLLSTASMAQFNMVKDYYFFDPASGVHTSNFNFVTETLDEERVVTGSTEDKAGDFDFHVTMRDINGNIIWDRLYDYSKEDYLTSITTIKDKLVLVLGSYVEPSTNRMAGKIMLLDASNGAIVVEQNLFFPSDELYLLDSDYSENLEEIVVSGFMTKPSTNVTTSYKEAYVASLDMGLSLQWEQTFNSGVGSDQYNAFSKSKYVEINGVDEIYLTGSKSYIEPFYGETQAVASILLKSTGAVVWDKPFIANFPGHWTFGVDFLENKGKNELIVLCQETETHQSFVALVDAGGAIIAGHHYYLGGGYINHFGRDLEWLKTDDVFVATGYQNHGSNNYKAYMIEIDADLSSGFKTYKKSHLDHDLYNYGSACTNPIFQPYIGLGAIRPYIFNSEFVTLNTKLNHLFLTTGQRPVNNTTDPIDTRWWRTETAGVQDCAKKITITDSKLYYTSINPFNPTSLTAKDGGPNFKEMKQKFDYEKVCGEDAWAREAIEVTSFNASVSEEGIVLENEGENVRVEISVSTITGVKVYTDLIQLEGFEVISLDKFGVKGIYMVDIHNLNSNERLTFKVVR